MLSELESIRAAQRYTGCENMNWKERERNDYGFMQVLSKCLPEDTYDNRLQDLDSTSTSGISYRKQ
jgi:hypothetical protein